MERKEWKPEQYNSNISQALHSLVVKCAEKVQSDAVLYLSTKPNNLAEGIWYHFPGYDYTWIDFASTVPGRLSGIKFNALQTLVWNTSLHEREVLTAEYNETCMIYPSTSSLRVGKGTYLKPGKLIQALFPEMDTDTVAQIASILALELRKLGEIDTSNIKISDDIGKVYTMSFSDHGSIGDSCMADKPSYMFDIYFDLDCKIAYLLDDDGLLIGRALLHKSVTMNNENKSIKLMDRVYCSNDDILVQFIEYAKQHGYHRKEEQNLSCKNYIAPNGDILEYPTLSINAKNLQGGYEKVPYIDTFKYYHEESAILCNKYRNGDELAVTIFDGTKGSDDNQLFAYPFRECYHCNNNENDYELHYLESHDEHVCESCLNNIYDHCDECERYVNNGDMIEIIVGNGSEYYCYDCVQEIAITCEYCSQHVHLDHIRTTEDNYNLCTYCYDNYANTCYECGETYYRDGVVQNGICDTCYEEMEACG